MALSDEGPRQPRRNSALSVSLVVVVAVLVLALGSLIGTFVSAHDERADTAPLPSAGMLAVSSQPYDGSHSVAVSLETAEPKVVRSNASGVVTKSRCRSGSSVDSGTAPLWLNGRPVIALATEVPLWRDLTPGVHGADVRAVQRELARLGYTVRVTGEWDRPTQSAMRSMWGAVGSTQPPAVRSLLVGQVMWMPAASLTVGSCEVVTGDPVTTGQIVMKSSNQLKTLVLATPPGGGWVAAYGDKVAPIDANGRITDPLFLAAFAAGPEFRFAQSAAGTEQGAAPQVTVRLATPMRVVAVPPSAIVDAEGASGSAAARGCVVTGDGPVAVRIVASSLGKTMVSVDGDQAVTRVLVNPDRTAKCP